MQQKLKSIGPCVVLGCICGSLFVEGSVFCVFEGVAHFSGGLSGGHFNCVPLNQLQHLCSSSTFLLSDVQGFAFVNSTQWTWAMDVHQRSEEFSLYISPPLEKQRMLCWGLFFVVCISYSYQAPICPSLWLPQSQATGNEVLVWPEGGKKRAFVSPL